MFEYPVPTSPRHFKDMDQLKRLHKLHGWHFFDAGALRFFNSRILPQLYAGDYFITSERFDEKSPRLFTIRKADARGDVDTVGEFQQYDTVRDAQVALAWIIRREKRAGRI